MGGIVDAMGPLGAADSGAGRRWGGPPLRAAPLSSLQPGPRISRKRNVQPRHTLLPGSAGNRAALFAGATGIGFAPPHGELKTHSVFSSPLREKLSRSSRSILFTQQPPVPLVFRRARKSRAAER